MQVQPRRLPCTIQTQALFKGATKTSTPYICIDWWGSQSFSTSWTFSVSLQPEVAEWLPCSGYIYNGQQGRFQDLPNSYRCPTCQAPKRRFKVYSPPQNSGGSKASSRNAEAAG